MWLERIVLLVVMWNFNLLLGCCVVAVAVFNIFLNLSPVNHLTCIQIAVPTEITSFRMEYEVGLYKAIWKMLMLLTNFYCIIQWTINFIIVSIKTVRYRFSQSTSNREFQLLVNCRNQLTKHPKHLSIIIGNSQTISSEILSKLVVYALITEIEYISFYDTRNQFTLDQITIPRYISSQKMQNNRFIWSMPGHKYGQLKYKNGLERSIEVVTLSTGDGKPLLAEVCRELYAKKNTNEMRTALKNPELLTKQIEQSLQKKLNHLPDPELVLIFDKNICTFGLLPWKTGFSEFHLIENGSYFVAEDFSNVLYKFSKCEQRFGT